MLNTISHYGNANEISVRFYFTSTRMAAAKETIISADKDVKKLEPSCVAGEDGKWCGQSGTSLAVGETHSYHII